MVIFHFAQLPVNQHFAAGLNSPAEVRRAEVALEPKPRRSRPTRREVTALDRAWRLGFAACADEGVDVAPPAGFSPEEADAFRAGADACFMGAWDAIDDHIERLESIALDRAACGF